MTNRWTKKLGAVAILSMLLMSACGTSEISQTTTTSTLPLVPSSTNPIIPFNAEEAFFPLHANGEGVFYSWDECTRRIIVCVNWQYKEVFIPFSDKGKMQWFLNNDFGLKKRERP